MSACKTGKGSEIPDCSGIPVRQEEVRPTPVQEIVLFEPQPEHPIPAGNGIRIKEKKVTNDAKNIFWQRGKARLSLMR
jgi:hypothetical protein